MEFHLLFAICSLMEELFSAEFHYGTLSTLDRGKK